MSPALRRARSSLGLDPALQTPAEMAALRALEETRDPPCRAPPRAQGQLEHAQAQAESVRTGLLYGTGAELVEAVAAALSAAGLTVVNVDELLEDTSSGDLLVSHAGRRLLIEVKSASGSAPEILHQPLETHL